MQQIVKVFQLGSSTVVTLPKQLGVKPGQKLSIKKTGGKIILKNEKLTTEDIAKLVDKLSGGLKLTKHPTPEEFNKVLENEYTDHEIMLPRR